MECPYCHYDGMHHISKKVSLTGWVLFLLLLLFCFPLFWLPFVLSGCKDETRKCGSCGARLG